MDLMSDGFNKEKVKKALRVVRIGGGNVEPNIMKTVNESVKELGEKWFTSEKIKLKDSEGKEFVTAVTYCKFHINLSLNLGFFFTKSVLGHASGNFLYLTEVLIKSQSKMESVFGKT